MDLKSINQSCRLCFNECGADFVNIFDDTLSGPTYSAQVMEMFQIELLETQNWPARACTNCVTRLEEIRRLKISITTAQSLIEEALLNISIKTERADKLEEDGDVPIELWCSPEWVKEESVDKETTEKVEEDGNMIEDQDYEETGNSQSEEDDEDTNSNAEDEEMEYIPGSDSEEDDEDNDMEMEDPKKTKRLVSKTNAQIFKCSFCPIVLQSASTLKSHERNIHKTVAQPKKRRLKGSPLSPEETEKAIKKLQRRKKSGKDEQNDTFRPLLQELSLLDCLECKQEHLNILDLWIHHLEVHKQAAVIECCNKKFFKIKTVHDHMRYHQDPQSIEFKCELCNIQFMTHLQKRTHISGVHAAAANGPIVCDICGSSFTSKSSLKTHKQRHLPKDQRPNKCPECGKGFLEPCMLRKHIESVHTSRDEKQSNYICDQCGKTFRTRHHLKAHSYVHDEGYMARYIAKHHARVPCDQCGKMCRRSSLKYHQKKYCQGSIAIDYKCHICGKNYVQQRSLSCHITNKHFPKNPPKQKEKKK